MSDELFGSYEKSGINIKAIAIGFFALVLIVGAVYGAAQYFKPLPPSEDAVLARQIRDNTILLLDYETYSGDEFRKQVLGRGVLHRYVKVNDEAFFSYPESSEEEFAEFVAKYFIDAKKLDHGRESDGMLRIGDYKISASPNAARFFRTNLANIKIEPDQTLRFPYANAEYTISLKEMNNFLNDSMVYGGRLVAQQGERTNRPMTIFANHGIMVAKPGEPSLTRLADAILKDVPADRETRIQTLVDFVANEIEYSYREALGGGETLKRASETLMTRNGDCSNKTILLASLLEQIGEEYIILYTPRHITVAVPIGNFPNENKVDFEFDSRLWAVAETTVKGFQIGSSKLDKPEILQLVNYVQDPKHMDVIYDPNSGEFLKFL
jgi:hypothetical protein